MPELTNKHHCDDVDINNVAPIQQKRILAFVNHFLTTMVQFLNIFAVRCERKMQIFEKKLQKVEASLLILEAKLSSIPELDAKPDASKRREESSEKPPSNTFDSKDDSIINIHNKQNESDTSVEPSLLAEEGDLVMNKEADKKVKDPKYERFFKMLQVGVPLDAVKLKMQSEGFDPSVLST